MDGRSWRGGMKTTVLGWYGHGNCGDESYREAFSRLLPHHTLRFTDHDAASEGDNLILGGGDVVYMPFAESFLGHSGRKVIASVSLTDLSHQGLLAAAERVWVRDYFSLDLANKWGFADVQYLPDFAFALRPNREQGKVLVESLFARARRELFEKLVVVVVSHYQADDIVRFQYLSRELAGLADHTMASFLFLPFSVEDPRDDRITNGWVSKQCYHWGKNLVLYQELTVQDTLNIISVADAVISTRLHASIFSTIGGVRFIDLASHTKNVGFARTIGKPSWSLPVDLFSTRRLWALLNSHLARGRSPSLLRYTKAARQSLSDFASAVFL